MSFVRILTLIGLLITATFWLSCGVRNFPQNKPFIYENHFHISGNEFSKKEKKALLEKLNTQLNDSLKIKVKTKLLFFKQILDPPAFDTSNALSSCNNLDVFFKTMGYYYVQTSFNYQTDSIIKSNQLNNQYRVTTHFKIEPGKPFRIDSVAYDIVDSSQYELSKNLQNLAIQDKEKSFLQKQSIFSENLISNELDRLVELFRNNGYYNFSRELLFAEADTVYLPLLNPLLNPFERMEALKKALERKDNPTINVYIRLNPKSNPVQLLQYQVGKVIIDPDYSTLAIDSSSDNIIPYEGIFIKSKSKKFKPSYISDHNHLVSGTLFKSDNLNKTFDEFNNLGNWQFIKIEPKTRLVGDSLSTTAPKIDFDINMMPSRKYALTADIESVFNQTQQAAIGTAGNLIGIGLNLGLRNRNFDRQGILIAHTFRGGIEAGIGQINEGLQATELTYNNSITIPKLFGFSRSFNKKFLYKRTLVNANLSAIDRNVNNNGLFRLTNVGAFFGWQIRNKRNELITFRPAYVEFVNLHNISSSFQKQLDTTPFLRYSFTQGLVLGNLMFSFSKPNLFHHRQKNHSSSLRIGFEESGLLFGRLKSSIPVLKNNLFEYVRAEMEIKYEIQNRKDGWAFRMATGAGYLLNDSVNMPFFKQFTGGGPNSMRAWSLRSIGPGATPLEKRSGRNQFFSRSGDMIFEVNAEYRFNVATVIPDAFIIRGACFTDIGNVWNLPNKTNHGNDTVVFHLKNFYRDLSVSLGTGIRFDFVGLFLLRIDFALRVKDPALPFSNNNNGWKNPKASLANFFGRTEEHRQWRYENFNVSLGINYPF
ncbi:MAG: BamA/TamA family outer membrane protein [Bacteroidetes bacterium]|nr:BamA/TamA family outer membrane protein [Bacteroidota bacterium]